jgi:hypothetical protein
MADANIAAVLLGVIGFMAPLTLRSGWVIIGRIADDNAILIVVIPTVSKKAADGEPARRAGFCHGGISVNPSA